MNAACIAIAGNVRPCAGARGASPRRKANAAIEPVAQALVVLDAVDHCVRRSLPLHHND